MSSLTTQPRIPARAIAGLAPLAASCLWGGMYVVSKASFASLSPLLLGFFRLLIGGLTLWVALWLSKRWQHKPRQQQLTPQARRRLPLLGVCVAATIITQFAGTDLADAHLGALLTTSTPVFVVLLAWLLLGERPHGRVLLGMMLALVGVMLVIGVPGLASTNVANNGAILLGDGLLVLSALLWALFTVLGAPLVRHSSALLVSTYATLWSLVFFVPVALWELGHHPLNALSPSSLLSVLYLGIGATALAWFLWYKGVEQLPTSVAAIFFFAQPLVGGLLSAIFLHETLGIGFWGGGCLLAVGILLVSRS